MYLNLVASLSGVDPALEEAATDLGSSGWTVFRRITLPLAAPGVFAGAVIVFIWSFTDLGTPLVFEFQEVISVQIFSRVTDIEENPEGYALVLWVLLMTGGGFITARYLFGRRRSGYAAKGGISSDRPVLHGWPLLGTYLLFGAVVFVSLLPHLAVVLTSLREEWFLSILPQRLTTAHYEAALAHPLTMGAVRNSLFLAGGATALDAILGVAIAYLLARVELRGGAVLDAVTMLPLALPGIVVAFGYLGAFGSTFLDARQDPTVLLIVAYSVRRLPYMVRSAYAGFSQVDQNLEEASWNLGASTLRTLWRVTLPLVAVSILAGGILAFSFAMLEVSDSLILALKEQHYPITKAIYMLLGRLRDGPQLACALGVWSMMFLGAALLFAHRILGRRMGELFKA
jgi:iron(III) transport system permease protein